ncbi:hypothetical protein DMUE_4461 [Dictyocoela muelleri]|nr:hypothetical protein DMUE_4461 [Dictyocoela muelleri]
MNKGYSLKKAVKKVEIHFNFTHHTILNASPMELINGYSVFDILNRDISSKFSEAKKQEKIKKDKEIKNKNKKRKEIRFNVGDNVLRKNIVQDKLLDRYIGPFKVMKVSEDYGIVWIKEGKRIVRHNAKNLKPYVGGVGCHTNDIHKKHEEIEKSEKNQNGKNHQILNFDENNQLEKFLEILNYKRKKDLNPYEPSSATPTSSANCPEQNIK